MSVLFGVICGVNTWQAVDPPSSCTARLPVWWEMLRSRSWWRVAPQRAQLMGHGVDVADFAGRDPKAKFNDGIRVEWIRWGEANRSKVVERDGKSRSLVAVVKRMPLRNAAEKHGRPRERLGVRVDSSDPLEGSRDNLFGEAGFALRSEPSTVMGDGQNVDVLRKKRQVPNLSREAGGIRSGEVDRS